MKCGLFRGRLVVLDDDAEPVTDFVQSLRCMSIDALRMQGADGEIRIHPETYRTLCDGGYEWLVPAPPEDV